MNQVLRDAVHEAENLPDDEQEELGRALKRLMLRRQIDAELAAAQLRGGRTPHAEFMAELKARCG